MNSLSRGLAIIGIASGAAFAQVADGSERLARQPSLEASFNNWRAEFGSNWFVRSQFESDYAEMIYGGSVAAPARPLGDAEWQSLARRFIDSSADLHGIENGELTLEKILLLPFGLVDGTDKMSVNFRQVIGGVPVVGGSLNVLLAMDGRLLSLHNTGIPETEGLGLLPSISAVSAAEFAKAEFSVAVGATATWMGAAELVIVRAPQDPARGRLAWQLELGWQDAGAQPVGFEYAIDAATGEVLSKQTTVFNFDVFGQVLSNASPGSLPDEALNPPQPLPMPFIRLTSSAGTVFTDADGNFNFPGVNSPLQITVDYRGSFVNVNNQAGADYSLTTTLQPNTPESVLMNPAPGQFITAQANTYLQTNNVGEFIRGINPADTTADFLSVANPNVSGSCNAFWDGGSTNFFRAGGGCVNMAYSTIVAHEFGHWLNALYGTGNGGDGMGEGNSDVWGMYAYDTHWSGEHVCGPTCNGRTGLNTRQYCGDGNGGCYGQVHADGEVWMGAAWKVRRNLKNALGAGPGGLLADNLFLGWMNAYNQTTIDSIIEIQWLTLDDDDGNIMNGTPNHLTIDAGFMEQGFPGFSLPNVVFSNVTELDDSLTPGPFSVDATAVANLAPSIASMTLRWRTEGGTYTDAPMTPLGGDLYSASIPGQSIPDFVEYYIVGVDSLGASDTFPADAPADVLSFGLGARVSVFDYGFQGNDDLGWVGGAPGDNASTGIWERANPVGTAAQPEDDVSEPGVRCWFTGQGAVGGGLGDNDVDGGSTTLTSPIFDGSGLAGFTVGYWRWYSNETGAAPNADVFRVDVSGDGGGSWTSLEIVGPGGAESSAGWNYHEELVANAIAPTTQMRLRFVASDLGSGSIVEAALDEISAWGYGSGCPAPQSYCLTSPNSVGPGAVIASSGSASIAANDLVVSVSGATTNQPGLFYYGTTQIQTAFGHGFRCAGGTTVRLGVINTDALGNAAHALDVTALPGGAQIQAGDTKNFQFWYRDPAGGGAAFNLSDGLAATFCP